MNLNNKHIDKWYFGDYKGSFSGSRYNELSYFLIFTFLVTIALSTEESLDPVYHSVYIPYIYNCLLYTSPSPRDRTRSRMPSSA